MTQAKQTNQLAIEKDLLDEPIPSEFFVTAIPNRSSKKRPAKLWRDANKLNTQNRLKLNIIFWVATLLGMDVDHIKPQSQGGSYSYANLRILPKSVNRMMSDNGWSHEVLNTVIADMGPYARKMLGIPEGFVSMDAWKLVETKLWKSWI